MSNAAFDFLDYESAPRRLFEWLLPLLVFTGLVCAAEMMLHENQKRKDSVAKQTSLSNTAEIRAILESDIHSNIYLTSGLVSHITRHDGAYFKSDIEPWLFDLLKQGRGIRNFSIAPKNRIETIVPLEGNEAALGLYLLDNPLQSAAVKQIMTTKTPILTGPIELKQGGLGLIYRVPLFLEKNHYWGFISTVLDVQTLFRPALQRSEELDLDLILIDQQADMSKQIIFGNPKIKFQDGLTLPMSVPGRMLKIYTQPRKQRTFDYLRLIERLAAWLVSATLAILIARTFQAYRRQITTYNALSESQQRFISAFNAAPQGMALLKQNGEWMSINPSLCQLLGYDAYRLLDLSPTVLSPQLHPQTLRDIWDAQGGGNPQFEIELNTHQGERLPCYASLAQIEHPNTHQSYWIFQVIDISRRVRAENHLHDVAEYTQTLLDHVDRGIISVNLNGGIENMNKAAQMLWKLKETPRHQLDIFDLLRCQANPNLLEELHQFIQKVAEQPNSPPPPLVRESLIRNQLGQSRIIEFCMSTVRQKNAVECLVLIDDISQDKRLKNIQSQTDEVLQQTIKPAIHSLHSSLKLIEGGVFGTLPNAIARIIHLALQHSAKANDVIQDLHDLQTMLDENFSLNVEELMLDEVVQQACHQFQTMTQQYQVQLQLSNPVPSCRARLDRLQFLQILRHLIHNAARFSRTEGIVQVSLSVQSTHALIQIQDHGTGIPAHFQDHLRQLLTHNHEAQSIKTSSPPCLGLQICKRLADAMDCQIQLHSREGHGSNFTISVPLILRKNKL